MAAVGAGAERVRFEQAFDGVPKAERVFSGEFLGLLERGAADAARGHVDDAAES